MVTVKPLPVVRRIFGAVLLFAAVMLLVGWTQTNTQQVIDASQAANAISAPFNPFAPLVAALLQALTPLAYFLTGMFAHSKGVTTGTK